MAVPAPPDRAAEPSAWWYALTIGVAVVGVVAAVSLLATGVSEARGTGREATLVELGSTATLTFDRVDSFTISYFGPPQVTSPDQVPGLLARLAIRIEPKDGGAPLELSPYEGLSSINEDRGSGLQMVSLATFRVEQLGDYTMTSRTLAGVGSSEAELTVATSPFRPLRQRGTAAAVVLLASLAVSAIATVALALVRGRAARSVRAAALAGPGGPWGAPPGGPGLAPPGHPPYGQWAQSPYRAPGWPSPPAAPSPPVIPPPPPGYGPVDRH